MADVNEFLTDLFGDSVVKVDYEKERGRNKLQELQDLPLQAKVEYAQDKIKEFVERVGGEDNVYVSFSGGKDSTVLLHLVRSVYPNVPAVFFNTGLEFPEIVDFVKGIDNVEIRKPRKTVVEVWRDNGIPVVSKQISRYINDVRDCKNPKTVADRLSFGNRFTVSKKWIHFTDKDFFPQKVSNRCCDYFKKMPSKDYEKETGRKAIVGTMADESMLRLQSWISHSCNMFDGNKIQSRPLSIWKESDIWEYIKQYDVKICELYYRGYERTGCFLCPYGSGIEDRKVGTNRFELLHDTHPNQYRALRKLGMRDVLLNMGVPIRNDEEYMRDLEIKQREIKEWNERVTKDIEEHGEASQYYKYAKYFKKK